VEFGENCCGIAYLREAFFLGRSCYAVRMYSVVVNPKFTTPAMCVCRETRKRGEAKRRLQHVTNRAFKMRAMTRWRLKIHNVRVRTAHNGDRTHDLVLSQNQDDRMLSCWSAKINKP